jgi:RNA polymerase sigma factor (sigma-70 family)
MSEAMQFQDLISRMRAGDPEAAAELVRSYEPAIRRIVRLRLNDSRLQRVFDSMDVCQSVLGSFFVRAALGQYDLTSPEQLLKLVSQMARHKVINKVRSERADKRDQRRISNDSEAAAAVAAIQPSPSAYVAGRELLDAVRARLSPPERELAEQRAQGREWADIAAERGESADALRKRLSRALDRIAQELGLDEESHVDDDRSGPGSAQPGS